MKKEAKSIILYMLMLFSLSGCDRIDSKSTSMSTIYGVATVISLLLLVTYCVIIHKKELWFLLLFSSVFVVNIGYFSLSISKTIEEALLANRISYLGSVFLPMSMLMIIITVCKLQYRKWLPCLLLIISVFVFLVAASPGYCDIYYKDVVLQTVNGVSILDKTYGEWHSIYLFYLVSYFCVMVIMSIRISFKKKMESNLYATILVGSVFINIGVWLLEQLVKIDFEVLSVSYIITEFFMLCLALTIQEHKKILAKSKKMVPKGHTTDIKTEEPKIVLSNLHNTETTIQTDDNSNQKHFQEQDYSLETKPTDMPSLTEQQEYFLSHLHKLTPSENKIYHYYLNGKATKEIIKELNITENTLKYHNKNIYSKLGVSSRKKLVEIATELKNQNRM